MIVGFINQSSPPLITHFPKRLPSTLTKTPLCCKSGRILLLYNLYSFLCHQNHFLKDCANRSSSSGVSFLALSCGSYAYFVWLFCSNGVPSTSDHVIIGVPFTGLMNGIRFFSQCHCCHTIILRYNNISLPTNTDQLIIHCIRSGSDDNNFAVTSYNT